MTKVNVKLAAILAVSTVAMATPATAATTFDMEGVAPSQFSSSLVLDDGPVQLTVTTEGSSAGFVSVANSSVPLIGLGVIGTNLARLSAGEFVPLRFTFSQPVDSVTFNYGDAGGDDDSPVSILAFSASDALLGSFTGNYPFGASQGGTANLNFAGASYFVASSGSTVNNENSILWDISAYTLSSAGAIPEPETWALLLLGLFGIGGMMRHRRNIVTPTVSYS